MKRFVVEVELYPAYRGWDASSNSLGAYFDTKEEAEEVAENYRRGTLAREVQYRVRDTQPKLGLTATSLRPLLHDGGTITGRTTWDTGTFWERDKETNAKNSPVIYPEDAYLTERNLVKIDFSKVEERTLAWYSKENIVESKPKQIVFVNPDANEIRLTSSLLVDEDGELNLIINNIRILRITAEGVLRRYINTEIAKLGLAVEANQIALGS